MKTERFSSTLDTQQNSRSMRLQTAKCERRSGCTNGSGHGALAGFLVQHGVDTLICGGIGGGAQNALAQAGIRLFGGVSGSADDAVNALLAGNLGYDPDVHCNHHDHHEEGHNCGDHGCGSHSCH